MEIVEIFAELVLKNATQIMIFLPSQINLWERKITIVIYNNSIKTKLRESNNLRCKNITAEEFGQCMSYIENSNLGLTMILLKQIWVLRKLANSHFCSDSCLDSLCALKLSLHPYLGKKKQ